MKTNDPNQMVEVRQGDLTIALDILVMYAKHRDMPGMIPEANTIELHRVLKKFGRLDGSQLRLGNEVGEQPWINDTETCLRKLLAK